MKYRRLKMITATVILMSFWKLPPVFGEPPTVQAKNSTESEMRQYSESEINTLIEDLTAAAEEAIEKAAAEAAKAAALASIERESRAVAEARHWQGKYETARKDGVKTAVITGVICLLSGLAVGAGTIAIYGGR
jgi:hypothetical protein